MGHEATGAELLGVGKTKYRYVANYYYCNGF
jgi:hypothetical protein